MVFKKGNIPWSKGKKDWNKWKHHSEETKKELSNGRLGNKNPMFGKKQSNEHKKKISEGNKGKKKTEEWKRMMSEKYKNRFFSIETRKKISESLKGKHLTEEHKIKIGKSNKGKNKGRIFSEEQKQKLRRPHTKEQIEKYKNTMKKKLQNKEYREYITKIIKATRAKTIFPIRDTKIELKIQGFLSILHIEYIAHKYMSEITHSYQCDILIPVQNGIIQKTIIECDGCYWHGCELCKPITYIKTKKRRELDSMRTQELIDKGFKVLRLWEHDIKIMDLNDFQDKLLSL